MQIIIYIVLVIQLHTSAGVVICTDFISLITTAVERALLIMTALLTSSIFSFTLVDIYKIVTDTLMIRDLYVHMRLFQTGLQLTCFNKYM